MKILSVVGARPQFVKVAVLVNAFDQYNRDHGNCIEHRLLHTGQHYDPQMSDVFFDELDLPKPYVSLGIGSATPGVQTAAMLASIEACLGKWRPDAVIIYGDTNSTLAAGLAAVKLHIPLVHLEAGLRSFNRRMPEEINRIISDHVSDLLLCPTATAVSQLGTEGLAEKARLVGDVMLDAVLQFAERSTAAALLKAMGLAGKDYALVTLHRAENTDDFYKLADVISTLEQLPVSAVLPVHPRLKKLLGDEGRRMLSSYKHIHLIDPVGYLEMLALQKSALLILTDSGGIQREAYFLGVPCLTLREETEWLETLTGGWNHLVGTRPPKVLDHVRSLLSSNGACPRAQRDLRIFGEGHAGIRSVEAVVSLGEGLR